MFSICLRGFYSFKGLFQPGYTYRVYAYVKKVYTDFDFNVKNNFYQIFFIKFQFLSIKILSIFQFGTSY